ERCFVVTRTDPGHGPGLVPDVRSWPAVDALPRPARVHAPPAGGVWAAVRPAADVLFAVVLLVPALPVIGLCWLAVRLTSAGPGFYTQTRLGRFGRPYRIVKLRTMRADAEAKSGVRWAVKGDSRITAVGRFLRASHFDELPQLFNVLRGEMSVIGPRPERPEVIRGLGLDDSVPGYDFRLTARPGVTGFAQVQLPPDEDVAGVRHKVAYDVYAITRGGFWLDVRILAATVLKVAGLNPERVRRVCRLPDRAAVAAAFADALTQPPPPPPAPVLGKQPSSAFQLV
ncbi:MAG: sugar transferase, partial [Fimbriiglobus sp.]